MSINGVIETSSGDLLRAGRVDFSVDGDGQLIVFDCINVIWSIVHCQLELFDRLSDLPVSD